MQTVAVSYFSGLVSQSSVLPTNGQRLALESSSYEVQAELHVISSLSSPVLAAHCQCCWWRHTAHPQPPRGSSPLMGHWAGTSWHFSWQHCLCREVVSFSLSSVGSGNGQQGSQAVTLVLEHPLG